MLEKIETILGINSPTVEQNILLTTLITLATDKLQQLVHTSVIPTSLEFIIIEVTVERYNKLGSEGLTEERIEGITRSYAVTSEFLPYMPYINAFNKSVTGNSGKFRFL